MCHFWHCGVSRVSASVGVRVLVKSMSGGALRLNVRVSAPVKGVPLFVDRERVKRSKYGRISGTDCEECLIKLIYSVNNYRSNYENSMGTDSTHSNVGKMADDREQIGIRRRATRHSMSRYCARIRLRFCSSNSSSSSMSSSTILTASSSLSGIRTGGFASSLMCTRRSARDTSLSPAQRDASGHGGLKSRQ